MSELVSDRTLAEAAPEPSMAVRPIRRPGVLGRLVRDPVGLAALVVVVVIVALALLSPVLSPTNPADNNLSDAMAPLGAPGLPLGADAQGRNMVTRLLFGLRLTLMMGVVAVLTGGTVGALIGFAAAFWRRVDGLLMRLMDVMLSFPAILFGLALAAILGAGVGAVILAMAVATVPQMARVVRGAALVVMQQDYIEAARVTGMSDARLIRCHLAPNCVSPILVFATTQLGQVILLGAALSFLGLGAQPPTAELGEMASEGRDYLFFSPHIAVLPCLAIFIIGLALNVLGDAMRDALDPRLRG